MKAPISAKKHQNCIKLEKTLFAYTYGKSEGPLSSLEINTFKGDLTKNEVKYWAVQWAEENMFPLLDKNGDGKVGKEEFMRFIKGNYKSKK